jgi:hypothetical protein
MSFFNRDFFFFLKKIVCIHPPLGYNQTKKTLSSSSTFIWSPTSFLRLLLGYHVT